MLSCGQMAIRIIHNTIPAGRVRQWAKEAVIDGIGDRPGDFDVEISASQTSAAWVITVNGPSGTWQREFSAPEEHDPQFIRNMVDYALPREIPLAVKGLCDDCIFRGLTYLGMNGPGSMLFDVGPLNDAFQCQNPSCGRVYQKTMGYFSPMEPRSRRRNRPVCGCGEETVMYIEAVLEPSAARFRCPACNAYRTEQGVAPISINAL